MNLTVAICTRNPRPDYFARVLQALAQQTLPPNEWELLIIDSASDRPLSGELATSVGLELRIVRLEISGLLRARCAAITNAKAPLILFLDDDNVPTADFLERGLEISARWPKLGCWCPGRVIPVCETPPSPEVKANLHRMVCWDWPTDQWYKAGDETPPGAGLFVRTAPAKIYAEIATSDPRRGLVGESAGKLLRGDDTDLVFAIVSAGYEAGRFVALKLDHLLPSRRLTWAYVLDLARAQSSSAVVVNKLWGVDPPRQTLLDRLIFTLKVRRLPRLDRELAYAQRAGEHEGRAIIATW